MIVNPKSGFCYKNSWKHYEPITPQRVGVHLIRRIESNLTIQCDVVVFTM
jgi:hypothetical protein